MWCIVRWDDLRYYSGVIPGYQFDERMVTFKTRFKTVGHLKKYKLNLKKTPKRLLK